MNRILGIASAMLLSFFVLLPVAAAAEPFQEVDHLTFSAGGDVTLPAGQHVDALVVVDGTATIEGDADGVVVVNGSARFVGAHAGSIIAVNSSVSLDPTTSVSGDIRTFQSTLTQAVGSIVEGRVVDGSSDVDWAFVARVAAALAAIAFLGLLSIGSVAGLAAAGLAARQVRSAGALISREPGMTIVAAFAGVVGLVLAGVLAIVTIVGIPVGLTLLIVVLPVMAFMGWLVAAIWLGDRILERATPNVTRERPYLAAVIGVPTLAVLGIVPFVGAVVAFFGFGAVTLALWRTFRGSRVTSPAATVVPATG